MELSLAKIFLMMMVDVAGAWIFFHVYEKTRHLIIGKAVYWILLIGLSTSFVTIDLGIAHGCRFVWSYFAGLVVSLFGVGNVVRHLKMSAIRDYLTGLLTRTFFFNEYLPREIKRAKRSEKPISVILMDVDDFKLINDIYGHKKGDEVLRKLSKAIQRSVRGSDAAVRFGGDEILIVLPETDRKGAEAVLKRIKGNLKKISEKSLPISISAGIAVWDGTKDFEHVIEKADKRMYKNKESKKGVNHHR